MALDPYAGESFAQSLERKRKLALTGGFDTAYLPQTKLPNKVAETALGTNPVFNQPPAPNPVMRTMPVTSPAPTVETNPAMRIIPVNSPVYRAQVEPEQVTQALPPNFQPPLPGSGVNTNNGITSLPNNYGFNELANYEEAKRKAYGETAKSDIGTMRTDVGGQYDKAYSDYLATTDARRKALADSLAAVGQGTFNLQNPSILEDLNRRGLMTSPSTVATYQADALKAIALENQNKLLNFDTTAQAAQDEIFNKRLAEMTGLTQSATAADLQAQQDALDSGLDLRRGGLENKLQADKQNADRDQANNLADLQRKNAIWGAGIGAAGSIAANLPWGKIFGGGAAASAAPAAVSAATGGAAAGGAAAAPAAGGAGLGTAALGAGAGLAGWYGANKLSPASQEGDQANMNVGGVVGTGAGAVLGSALGPAGTVLGAGLGGAIGTGVGKASNRLVLGTDKALGKTMSEVVKYANPITAIAGVGEKLGFSNKSHTDTKGSDAWAQGKTKDEIALMLGRPGGKEYGTSYDSNKKDSAVNNYNAVIASFTPEQLVMRYAQDASQFKGTTKLDADLKAAYDEAVQLLVVYIACLPHRKIMQFHLRNLPLLIAELFHVETFRPCLACQFGFFGHSGLNLMCRVEV